VTIVSDVTHAHTLTRTLRRRASFGVLQEHLNEKTPPDCQWQQCGLWLSRSSTHSQTSGSKLLTHRAVSLR